jgi:hypothetical protein
MHSFLHRFSKTHARTINWHRLTSLLLQQEINVTNTVNQIKKPQEITRELTSAFASIFIVLVDLINPRGKKDIQMLNIIIMPHLRLVSIVWIEKVYIMYFAYCLRIYCNSILSTFLSTPVVSLVHKYNYQRWILISKHLILT